MRHTKIYQDRFSSRIGKHIHVTYRESTEVQLISIVILTRDIQKQVSELQIVKYSNHPNFEYTLFQDNTESHVCTYKEIMPIITNYINSYNSSEDSWDDVINRVKYSIDIVKHKGD